MSAPEWYGVPCDDPAERVGEYADRDDDRGALWEELSADDREYLTRQAQR